MGEVMIYGVSWVAVMAVLLALLRQYAGVSAEWEKVIAAVGAVVGYLVVTNLAQLESLWPAMPVVVPQVLTAVLIFGATLGLIPGEVTARVFNRLRGK